MGTNYIIPYSSLNVHSIFGNRFEEAFYQSKLIYSIRHLQLGGDFAQQDIEEALQKVLQICQLVRINSKHHFKQIFVFDADKNTIYVDLRMSKSGFNLIMMQLPSTNKKMAHWLVELAAI